MRERRVCVHLFPLVDSFDVDQFIRHRVQGCVLGFDRDRELSQQL
jgi:hypothetical protein